MPQKIDETKIQSMIDAAEVTAYWIEKVAELIGEYEQEKGVGDANIKRYLGTATSALLRWRLEAGQCEGLLTINEVEDWKEDEFD